MKRGSDVCWCSGEPGEADAARSGPVWQTVAGRETVGGAGDGERHQRQEDVRTQRHYSQTRDGGTGVRKHQHKAIFSISAYLLLCTTDSFYFVFLQLGDALQNLTQVSTELSLQQKLRDDAHLRVEELEETLLDKDQELQRLQSLVSKLQGEVIKLFISTVDATSQSRARLFVSASWLCVCVQVSGKLIDKERTLEEEIQLRERLQLMCKQAERTVEDLTMELQSTNQAKEDLAKQLKQTQVLLALL